VTRSELAQAVQASGIDEPLRAALADAIRGRDPVRTVRRLAGHAGISRAWMDRLWRESRGGDTEASLATVLRKVLFVRALELRIHGKPWPAIADGLGVGVRTLRRLVHDWIGMTLDDVSPERARTALEQEMTWLMSVLDQPGSG